MAAMIGLLASRGVGVGQIVAVTIPSSIIAIVVGSVVMMRWGKDLKDDPEYQQRLKDGKVPPPNDAPDDAASTAPLPQGAALSAYIFITGVFAVVFIGLFNGKSIGGITLAMLPKGADMTIAIQLIMFTVALLILVFCKTAKVGDVIKEPVFTSGVIAVVALFGIAWLANTFIAAYNAQIVALLNNWVTAVPLFFAVAVFIFAALTTSQSATTNTIVPIGLALPALSVGAIIAMWQALCGVYFLPANGNQLACVATDLTGSTKIGKYVLNHSFMVPLLVTTVVAVGVGMVIQSFIPGLH
jgi:anaerobic C4-dicarboxylate transporter DcuA/anaerobic C4-dicarboxylate transporter DcuB